MTMLGAYTIELPDADLSPAQAEIVIVKVLQRVAPGKRREVIENVAATYRQTKDSKSAPSSRKQKLNQVDQSDLVIAPYALQQRIEGNKQPPGGSSGSAPSSRRRKVDEIGSIAEAPPAVRRRIKENKQPISAPSSSSSSVAAPAPSPLAQLLGAEAKQSKAPGSSGAALPRAHPGLERSSPVLARHPSIPLSPTQRLASPPPFVPGPPPEDVQPRPGSDITYMMHRGRSLSGGLIDEKAGDEAGSMPGSEKRNTPS